MLPFRSILNPATIIDVALILLFIFVAPVSAVSMDVTPSQIHPGDTVSITIQDLADDTSFSLYIMGNYEVTNGEEFSFRLDDLTIPFSLKEGKVQANALNSEYLFLNYQNDAGTTKTVGVNGDEKGTCIISESLSVSAGTYRKMWLEGLPTANTISTTLNLVGIKKGPEDSEISFQMTEIGPGVLTIKIIADGALALNKNLPILSASGETGSSSTVGAAPGEIPFAAGPTGVQTSAIPSTSDPQITSIDGAVIFSAPYADTALLVFDVAKGFPEGWTPISDAYSVVCNEISTTNPGTVHFKLPEDGQNTAVFVAHYSDGTWNVLPATIRGDYLSATISAPGTGVLMKTTDSTQTAPTASAPGNAPESAGAATSSPGFGVLTALLALGAFAAVLLRKD